jgi:hypothetical protein
MLKTNDIHHIKNSDVKKKKRNFYIDEHLYECRNNILL